MSKIKKPTAAQSLYASLGVDMVMRAQFMHRDTSVAGNAPQSERHRSARQHAMLARARAKVPVSDKQKAIAAEIMEGRKAHLAELARKNMARTQHRLNAAASALSGNAEASAILGALGANNGMELAA